MPRSTDATPRLRAKPLGVPLHVVLVEPEIPPNTGNVARLCAATASPMHLVDVRRHLDFEHFLHAFGKEAAPGKLHLFSALATRSYLDVEYAPGDALVFGRESVGLSEELLARFPDRVVGIPTLGAVRSLNLANAVGIALYEALRKLGALSATFVG